MFGWFKKSNNDSKTKATGFPSDDFWTHVKKRQDEEREKLNKWRKNRKSMNSNNTGSITTNSSNTWTTGPGYVGFADNTYTETALSVDVPLLVNGRDVMKELDELRESMLLLTRDLKLEEHYPELKEAYDEYMELYRGIKIADKMSKTGDT